MKRKDRAPVPGPEGGEDDPGAVDDVTLQRWLADCNPFMPIDPSDRRYFDLDRVEAGGELIALRGDDHIAGLFDAVTLSEGQSCQLFSGFSGTGKSTELRRLTHLLEERGYSVLLVNAQDYHDLNHELNIGDLLVILAGAFGEAASTRLGKDVPAGNYWDRFREFLGRHVELQEIKLPTGIADLKIGIRHDEPFWTRVRNALTGSLGKLRDHSHSYIKRCVAALEEAERPTRGVVFILDSLERLTAPVTDFREVMESAVRVMTHYSDLLRLPACHVIYTIPPYVQLISPALKDRYDRASLVLPAIKVLERGEGFEPYQPGIDALADLLGKRIPLERVFGSRRDLLEKLIIYSGGHVRMLISFTRELLFRARRGGLPPSGEDIERVVQPFREQVGMAIWQESVPLLERIRQRGAIEGIREQDYPYLARFMDNYVVLCYRNGDGWYEIHPLAGDVVRRLADEVGTADRTAGSPVADPCSK